MPGPLPVSRPGRETAKKRRLARLVTMIGRRAAEERVKNSERMALSAEKLSKNGFGSIKSRRINANNDKNGKNGKTQPTVPMPEGPSSEG